MAKKPSMGRQKIKITKIEKKDHLQITFSKRRADLFKKASELCTLCGVEVAIIVFSPSGKVLSFGHPNVNAIVNKFLSLNPSRNHYTSHLHEAQRSTSLVELNFQLDQVLNVVEAEKRNGEIQDDFRKASEEKMWWASPINKLGLNELELLRTSMVELKQNVKNHGNKLLADDLTFFSPFLINGGGFADQFDNKPIHMIHGFGYDHGFF